MSRTPPARTPAQQQAHDRIEALRTGTLAAVRAYAAQYGVALFGLDDDELLMISIHEAREVLFTGKAKRESAAWLVANRDRIVKEREDTPDA